MFAEIIHQQNDLRRNPSDDLIQLTKIMMNLKSVNQIGLPKHVLLHYHPPLKLILEEHQSSIVERNEVHSQHHLFQSLHDQSHLAPIHPPQSLLPTLIKRIIYSDFNTQELRHDIQSLDQDRIDSWENTLCQWLASLLNLSHDDIQPILTTLIETHGQDAFYAQLDALAHAEITPSSLMHDLWVETLHAMQQAIANSEITALYPIESLYHKLQTYITQTSRLGEDADFLRFILMEPYETKLNHQLRRMWQESGTEASLSSLTQFIVNYLNSYTLGKIDAQAVETILTQLNHQSITSLFTHNLPGISRPEELRQHINKQIAKRHHIILAKLGLYQLDNYTVDDFAAMSLESFTRWCHEAHKQHQANFFEQYKDLLNPNTPSQSIYGSNQTYTQVIQLYWYKLSQIETESAEEQLNLIAQISCSQHYSLISLDGRPRCFKGLNQEAEMYLYAIRQNDLGQTPVEQTLQKLAQSVFDDVINLDNEQTRMRLFQWWQAHPKALITDEYLKHYQKRYGFLYPDHLENKDVLHTLHASLVETLMHETGLSLRGARSVVDYLNVYYLKHIKTRFDADTLWQYIDTFAEDVAEQATSTKLRLVAYADVIKIHRQMQAAYQDLITSQDTVFSPNKLDNQYLGLLQPHLLNVHSLGSSHLAKSFYRACHFPNAYPFREANLSHTSHNHKTLQLHQILNTFFELRAERPVHLNHKALTNHFCAASQVELHQLREDHDIGTYQLIVLLLNFLQYDIFFQQDGSAVNLLENWLKKTKLDPQLVQTLLLKLLTTENNPFIRELYFNWLALTRPFVYFATAEYDNVYSTEIHRQGYETRLIHFFAANIPEFIDVLMDQNTLDLGPDINSLYTDNDHDILNIQPVYRHLHWSELIGYAAYIDQLPSPNQSQKDGLSAIRTMCISQSVALESPLHTNSSLFKNKYTFITKLTQPERLQYWLMRSLLQLGNMQGTTQCMKTYFRELAVDEKPFPPQWSWLLCHLSVTNLMGIDTLDESGKLKLRNQFGELLEQYQHDEKIVLHLQKQINRLDQGPDKHCCIS